MCKACPQISKLNYLAEAFWVTIPDEGTKFTCAMVGLLLYGPTLWTIREQWISTRWPGPADHRVSPAAGQAQRVIHGMLRMVTGLEKQTPISNPESLILMVTHHTFTPPSSASCAAICPPACVLQADALLISGGLL
jgi:hypothetical protein